jgi:hypothetical protein
VRHLGVRRARARALAVAAVAALAGGLVPAAAGGGPGSPLWPVTRVVFADRADSRLAEGDVRDAMARARDAVEQRRYSDAERLLGEAAGHANRVDDPALAGRLRGQIAVQLALLPGALADPPPHQ